MECPRARDGRAGPRDGRAGARGLAPRLGDPHRVGVPRDPVHPGTPGPGRSGQGGHRHGGVIGLRERAGRPVRGGQQPAQEPFPGRADQHRERPRPAAERADLIEVGEQGPVVLGPLGEAQARIENDHGRVHPGLRHHVDPAAQFLAHLRHHVLVDGPGIHAVAVTPPVHHHVGNSRGRDEPGHLGIGQATAHVVDQPGPRLQGPLGHLGPHRVHAHRDTRRGQALDDRPGPAQFLRCGDALRTRAGGLPAHVHDVRALGQEFQAVRHPGLRAEPLAPVGEGVGGDVHHAHDQAPSRVGKPRRAGCPGRVDDHGVTLRGHLPVPPALARHSARPGPPRPFPQTVPRNGANRPGVRTSRGKSRPDGPLLLERGGAPDTSRGTCAGTGQFTRRRARCA